MSDTPTVEIYTSAACGYCMRALRLLDSKNITYEQIDTSMNSALRADMRSRSGGRHTVPQIFIDNEHSDGGNPAWDTIATVATQLGTP